MYLCVILLYSELHEAQRWNNDPSLWTPMAVLTNGQHLFIGDIFEYDNKITGICLGKAENFIYMVCIKYIFLLDLFGNCI